MSPALPPDPDLDQLRTRARQLQRAVRAGRPDAWARVVRWHPAPPVAGTFPLTSAQLVVAREYGFAGWAGLRRSVEILSARSWNPDRPVPDDESVADRFLRLACLTYGRTDTDADRADADRAAALLAEDPRLPGRDPFVAAACAAVADLRRHLAGRPGVATATGGPYGWSPLLYLAYARHDPQIGAEASRECVRLLLAHGADADDGRFRHGLPTPFTVLTGVLGGGEGDQPAHPHALALAEVLLEAGADPHDGQALYNRMFSDDDDHLVLLFAHGLGRRAAGPWHRPLGESVESPAVMLRSLLAWAVAHDQRRRVALLAAHGVDVVAPFTEPRAPRGRTPVESALLSGHRELADDLLALGAAPPRLRPADAFVAAVLAGDAETVRATPAKIVAGVRERRPGLVTWAAAQGAPGAVELLVEAGFDVNARGRSDVPGNRPWHCALHVAAERGDLALARRLLELGADPDLIDARFGATALGWARHFRRTALVELLDPVTSAGPARQ